MESINILLTAVLKNMTVYIYYVNTTLIHRLNKSLNVLKHFSDCYWTNKDVDNDNDDDDCF